MTITPLLRKDQPDKDGLCKIIIRVNEGNKRTYHTTDIKVKPSQFVNAEIVRHPKAKELNRELTRIIYSLEDGDTSKEKTLFEEYCNRFINDCKENNWRKPGTLRHYNAEKNKFLGFAGNIPIHKIDSKLLKGYNKHLVKIGNQNNTIWGSFKFMKMILKRAKVKIELEEKIVYKQTTRTFLTAKEVKAIKDLKLIGPIKICANWFLFQCHTGMRVGDLRRINIPEIKETGRLIIGTSKTGEIVSIPIAEEVKDFLSDPFDISAEDYNRNLKSIAHLAGIKKNLTSHVARHTAGMRMAELRISRDVTAMILGHKKLATTDIYYKIQNARVDEEFSGFGF